MNLNSTKNHIALVLLTLISSNTLFATATPIFSIVPVTPNSNYLTFFGQTVITVPYTVTNNTFITRTLTLNPTPGVSASASSAPNGCSVPFVLAPRQSCVLNIVLTAPLLPVIFNAGPEICKTKGPNDTSPTPFLCAQPAPKDRLNGTVDRGHSVGGTVSGLLGSVTLLNNGADALTVNNNGSFTFPTDLRIGATYNVTVGTQPQGQGCSVTNPSGIITDANVTNVTVTCSIEYTTLALVAPTPTQANRIIPVVTTSTPNPTPLTLTIQNTGATFNAYNVHAVLPSGWTGVTQTPTNCATVAPGGTCTLSFTSTTPYIAQNNIQITADYVQTPPTTALAFSINGNLVFSTGLGSAEVIQQNNLPNSYQSFPSDANTGAYSLTDGAGNTSTLLSSGAVGSFAAKSCNAIGGYEPAICQFVTASGIGCSGDSIYVNLIQYGFGAFPNSTYGTSTQQTSFGNYYTVILPGGTFDTADYFFTNTIRCAQHLATPY